MFGPGNNITCLARGFGSGDYVSKSEATDVLSDLEGRWIRYDLTGRADEYLESKIERLFLEKS